ncbi:acyl carrier protein [Aspergillus stella-maris]|uniref:acyl carrier protein n=1 Tax=Aspergillus stella-maris TaxID=1810926 RepID=UPI003CCE4D8B
MRSDFLNHPVNQIPSDHDLLEAGLNSVTAVRLVTFTLKDAGRTAWTCPYTVSSSVLDWFTWRHW